MWRSDPRNPLLLRALVVGILLLVTVTPLAAQKFFPDKEHGVDNKYIVVLPRDLPPASVAQEATRLTNTYGGVVEIRWKSVLRGFLATMTEKQAYGMSQDAGVVGVYQNRRFEGTDASDRALSNATPYCYTDTLTFNSMLPAPPPAVQQIDCVDPDPSATGCIDNWGLDRLDDSFNRDGTFGYRENGSSVDIYVLDTGVHPTHDEFQTAGPVARVRPGIDATVGPLPSGDPDCSQPSGGDVLGHGTHVAGIAGGNEFGVAKGIWIIPVRQLQGPPLTIEDPWIINAMECIAEAQVSGANTAIVNLSGLNDETWTEDSVIQQAVIGMASLDNLLLVQSAGNFYPTDACSKTFGDESDFTGPDAEAIARVVVAAGSDEIDGPWIWAPGDENPSQLGTDLGPCVDLFAPAAHIVSSWSENPSSPDQGICRLTGTSMAAPHVSGTLALMLQSKRDATAPEVRGDLLDQTLADVLTLDDPLEAATPNRLVHRDTNRIFFSGFHHDLSRWWSEGDLAALSFCDWTGPVFGGGTTAYCVDLGADAWLEDRRPTAESTYDFYFRYDFSQAALADEHIFFEARTNAGLPAFRLKVRKSGAGSVEVGAFAFDNTGIEVGTWIDHSSIGFVRGYWEAGTSGTFAGSLGISPRGPEYPWSFPVGNNSNRLIGEVVLGAISVHPATTGLQRFRQFRSWRDRNADPFTPTFDP